MQLVWVYGMKYGNVSRKCRERGGEPLLPLDNKTAERPQAGRLIKP